jgi:hypothetical protein
LALKLLKKVVVWGLPKRALRGLFCEPADI